ncbi:hypothetical protein BsWGS_05724 [Bradybaena similaris]
MSDSKLIRQASLSSAYLDPGQRIKVLVEYGSHLEVDKTLALKHYFRSGHEMLRMANMYCDDGQLESAFILYYRYIALFMEKLTAHPDFSSANQVELAEIKRRVKKVFPIAEEIKSKLKKRYTEEEHIYKEQQRRLAAEKAAQEEERRKALEEQQKQDEELARKLQEEEEAEVKSLQEEKYRKLRMQEEEKLKNEQRKKQALDAGAPPVVHNGSSYASGISVADAALPVASLDIETAKPHLPEVPPSEMAALPPPPSYSDFLSEIATNRPQIPDRELKKKLVISDINVPPIQPQVPVIDRRKKPFLDHHMSLGEFGDMKAGQLRTVIVPSSLMSKFLSAAAGNTSREAETMGILCGKLSHSMFIITNLFIPQQKGGHDSCDMENEEELIDYQDKHNLITLGWIHTHPTQTAFLSSVDLHSHFPWQKMMPEAIAIVCSPKFEETGIFKLTDHGLDIIGSCKQKGFHPHSKEPPLFETCGHVQISDQDTVAVENKMK